MPSDEDETIALEGPASVTSPAHQPAAHASSSQHPIDFPTTSSSSQVAPRRIPEAGPSEPHASVAPSLASLSNDSSAHASPALRPCSPVDTAEDAVAEERHGGERQAGREHAEYAALGVDGEGGSGEDSDGGDSRGDDGGLPAAVDATSAG